MPPRFSIRSALILLSFVCLSLTFFYPRVRCSVLIDLRHVQPSFVQITLEQEISRWYDNVQTSDFSSFRASTSAVITNDKEIRIELSGPPYKKRAIKEASSQLAKHIAETYNRGKGYGKLAAKLEELINKRTRKGNLTLTRHVDNYRALEEGHTPSVGVLEMNRDYFLEPFSR